MAKSRWEIENQGFHHGKNLYGMEHICHHEPTSILIVWLLVLLALVIERLYRLRFLHRGDHEVAPILSAQHMDLLARNLAGARRQARGAAALRRRRHGYAACARIIEAPGADVVDRTVAPHRDARGTL